MYKSIVRDVASLEAASPQCRILHLGWENDRFTPPAKAGKKRAPVPPHSHPFWQLELVFEGAIHCEAEARPFRLQAGHAILIPPGAAHRFWYEEPHAFLSIKFKLNGVRPFGAKLIGPSGTVGALLGELSAMLSPHVEVDLVAEALPLVDQLLSCLVMAAARAPASRDSPTPDPMERLVQLVRRRPELGSIAELSRELGYSPGHLTVLFKKTHAKPLKPWLDAQRARIASEMLHWADLSIAEISRRLGFPDSLGFSHFFRRVTGRSPRAFRKQI